MLVVRAFQQNHSPILQSLPLTLTSTNEEIYNSIKTRPNSFSRECGRRKVVGWTCFWRTRFPWWCTLPRRQKNTRSSVEETKVYNIDLIYSEKKCLSTIQIKKIVLGVIPFLLGFSKLGGGSLRRTPGPFRR